MELRLDEHVITPKPGQSLLEMVQDLNLDDRKLSCRPLAAKIAGEVFTLNYVPMRHKDMENTNVRSAMAESGGEVRLLRYADAAGRSCYIRTAQFVIFLALSRLWPDAKAKMHCTVSSGM